jgi:hypothetical protein
MGTKLGEIGGVQVNAFYGGAERGVCVQFTAEESGYAQVLLEDLRKLLNNYAQQQPEPTPARIEKRPETFEEADFYTCTKDAESLSHEDVESALDALVDELPEDEPLPAIAVYAHRRAVVTTQNIKVYAQRLFERLEEDYGEDYGPADDPAFADDGEEILAALEKTIVEVLGNQEPWQCEQYAEKTFSPEEVKELLAGQPVDGTGA